MFLHCSQCVARATASPLPLPFISMAAERTCRSIWLIIFTLPAEAALSWGYLHRPHLSSLCSVQQRLALSIQSPFPLPPVLKWTSIQHMLSICKSLYHQCGRPPSKPYFLAALHSLTLIKLSKWKQENCF